MKVNPQNASGMPATATQESAGAQEVNRSTGVGSSKSESAAQDRLELSGFVGKIAGAEAAHAAQRTEHVRALAKLYRTGAYVTEPRALSRKLIQEALADRPAGGENR